ncbi:hypothetical protein D3C75_1365970 [compost metagenome]
MLRKRSASSSLITFQNSAINKARANTFWVSRLVLASDRSPPIPSTEVNSSAITASFQPKPAEVIMPDFR